MQVQSRVQQRQLQLATTVKDVADIISNLIIRPVGKIYDYWRWHRATEWVKHMRGLVASEINIHAILAFGPTDRQHALLANSNFPVEHIAGTVLNNTAVTDAIESLFGEYDIDSSIVFHRIFNTAMKDANLYGEAKEIMEKALDEVKAKKKSRRKMSSRCRIFQGSSFMTPGGRAYDQVIKYEIGNRTVELCLADEDNDNPIRIVFKPDETLIYSDGDLQDPGEGKIVKSLYLINVWMETHTEDEYSRKVRMLSMELALDDGDYMNTKNPIGEMTFAHNLCSAITSKICTILERLQSSMTISSTDWYMDRTERQQFRHGAEGDNRFDDGNRTNEKIAEEIKKIDVTDFEDGIHEIKVKRFDFDQQIPIAEWVTSAQLRRCIRQKDYYFNEGKDSISEALILGRSAGGLAIARSRGKIKTSVYSHYVSRAEVSLYVPHCPAIYLHYSDSICRDYKFHKDIDAQKTPTPAEMLDFYSALSRTKRPTGEFEVDPELIDELIRCGSGDIFRIFERVPESFKHLRLAKADKKIRMSEIIRCCEKIKSEVGAGQTEVEELAFMWVNQLACEGFVASHDSEKPCVVRALANHYGTKTRSKEIIADVPTPLTGLQVCKAEGRLCIKLTSDTVMVLTGGEYDKLRGNHGLHVEFETYKAMVSYPLHYKRIEEGARAGSLPNPTLVISQVNNRYR